MKKLPLIRQGQGFDYTILNLIINTINELMVDQPGYDRMMNDLASITNQYTTKIASFIERYKDIVDNTPTMMELLKAYAELKDKVDNINNVSYEISSIQLDFVKNTIALQEGYEGVFLLDEAGVPIVTDAEGNLTIVRKGQSILAISQTDLEQKKRASIFIQCNEIFEDQPIQYSWICLDSIAGPEGPQGVQGIPGITPSIGENGNWFIGSRDTKKPSKGEDGLIVKIIGKINSDTANEGIPAILDELSKKLNEADIGKGYVYDNEKQPCIFVYVHDNKSYVEGEDIWNQKWIRITSIRGPQGPAGKTPSIEIGFSKTPTDAIVPSSDINYDDTSNANYLDNFFYLCLAEKKEGQNNLNFTRVRFRQRTHVFSTKTRWSYLSQGEYKTFEEDIDKPEKGYNTVKLGELGIDKQTNEEYQDMIFTLLDNPQVTSVDINNEGKFVFTLKNPNLPDNVEPKPDEIKITATGNITNFFDNEISKTSERAVKNRAIYAALDKRVPISEDGKIDESFFPASVGKFISGTYKNSTSFIVIKNGQEQEADRIVGATYIDKAGNKTYGWSGTEFVEVAGNLVIGTQTGTAFDGGKGKIIESQVNDWVSGNGSIPRADKANADEQGNNLVETYLTKLEAKQNYATITNLTTISDTANAAKNQSSINKKAIDEIKGVYVTTDTLTKKDYATNTALTNGLASKQAKGNYATKSELPTKTSLGLSKVNNTSDSEKPVSTAQSKAIADAKKAGTDAQSTADGKSICTLSGVKKDFNFVLSGTTLTITMK